MNAPRMKWHQRVRTRLTLAVMASIIVPMLLFFALSTTVATRAQLRTTGNDLRNMAEHVDFMLDDLLKGISLDLRPSIYDPNLATLPDRELEIYLSLFLHRLPYVDGLSFVDVNGKERARISLTQVYFPEQLRDLGGSPEQQAVLRDEMYYGRPFVSDDGKRLMSMAVPSYDDAGRLEGGLVAEVSLRRVFQQPEVLRGPRRIMYMVDQQGVVIAHPTFALVSKQTDLSGYKVVSAALKLSPSDVTRMMYYRNPEGDWVFGLGRRTRLGWAVIAEEPASLALAEVREITGIFTIIFASAGLVGLVGSLLIGSRATRAFLRIQNAARAIGGGDFNRRVPRQSVGEMGELEHNVNMMAGKLEEYYHHLEHDVDLLNQQVDQRTESLRKAYDELQARDNELRSAQTALVQTEKLASLGQLVAGVVHEINNPLSYVLNNIQVIKRDTALLGELSELHAAAAAATDESERKRFQAEAEELAQRIDAAETAAAIDRLLAGTADGLQRIRKIVQDLRDFSRTGETQMEPTDLCQLAETTLSILAYELKRKQIEVVKDCRAMPPIPASPIKISQVLINIIMNAIQAVPERGHIWVSTAVEDGWAAIHVRDDGHGIPEEIVGKIFDPFFTTRPRGEGTGLGLSVSYGIVKEHEGTIDVRSTPGKGAEFVVRLPLKRAETA